MDDAAIIDWLKQGDPAIAYQTERDLLNREGAHLQARIRTEGWGKTILSRQNDDTSWGQRFYQPKWISTHYSLLELKGLAISPSLPPAQAAIQHILATETRADGGLGPGKTIPNSDVCVAGMFLNYASYFQTPKHQLKNVVDFLLNQRMPDGGYNCESNQHGAHHSSVHSTLSVLEGIESYRQAGHGYRLSELLKSAEEAREFLLVHRLFRSHRTGEIIHKDFLKLVYPARWKFNILRALDYFQSANIDWDDRLQDAIDVLHAKRGKDGRWKGAAQHSGQHHLQMESPREPSRWNTLMAIRVLNHFQH